MKLETLRKITDHDLRPDLGNLRELCQHPWQINFSGVEYTLATCGRSMVILKNQTNEFLPMRGEDCAKALVYLQEPGAGAEIKLATLKAWAGEPIWQLTKPCSTCRGSGKDSCPGAQECSCPDFNHDGFIEWQCEDCGGTGKGIELPVRVGRIGEHFFNRNLIACVLETAEAETVTYSVRDIAKHGHVLTVNGAGWRAWVMGIYHRYMREDEKAAAPALEG